MSYRRYSARAKALLWGVVAVVDAGLVAAATGPTVFLSLLTGLGLVAMATAGSAGRVRRAGRPGWARRVPEPGRSGPR